jgi:hypothetical protein
MLRQISDCYPYPIHLIEQPHSNEPGHYRRCQQRLRVKSTHQRYGSKYFANTMWHLRLPRRKYVGSIETGTKLNKQTFPMILPDISLALLAQNLFDKRLSATPNIQTASRSNTSFRRNVIPTNGNVIGDENIEFSTKLADRAPSLSTGGQHFF